MDDDLIEVYDTKQETPFCVYVSIGADWNVAILAAAKCTSAEIVVTSDRTEDGLVVYSDEPGTYSSPFWADQVQERRRWLGR
jgi:hypothetical protein